jgi:predicted nucleic acid-binding protein
MKVFLDANVLFSAALPGSRMGEFLGFVRGQAELASSQAAVDEALRNVERKVSDAPPVVRNLQDLLRSVGLTPLVADLPGVELVEKDRHILGAAVASQCSHLLTGDERHFKHLFGCVVSGVRIVHPALLAEELRLRRSKSTS